MTGFFTQRNYLFNSNFFRLIRKITLRFDKSQPFPILYIFVPQVGQMPFVAGLPFFIVTDFGFFISFFFLHLTQYPVVILSVLKEGIISKTL